jgi:SAM-dependent methyltransferase
MLSQRPSAAAPAVRAEVEALPFRSGSFDAAMAVLTVHHWSDRSAGFAEMRRVARVRVVLTFDPLVHNQMWLMSYIPEMVGLESARAPSLDEVYTGIEGRCVLSIPVPHDCQDAMTIANWRHPEAYLDSAVRAGGSALRQVDGAALQRGLDHLADDLRTGRWLERHGDLLTREELDCGLRLVVGKGA